MSGYLSKEPVVGIKCGIALQYELGQRGEDRILSKVARLQMLLDLISPPEEECDCDE